MKPLLVMSGRNVSYEMEAEYGEMPPVLMPLGVSCFLDRLVESYTPYVDRIVVFAGKENFAAIETYISGRDWQNVSCWNVGDTGDIGETFSRGVECLEREGWSLTEGAWIIYGDTMVDSAEIHDLPDDAVVVSPVDDNKRWATVGGGGRTLVLYDKGVPQNPFFDAVVGLFAVSDVLRLHAMVQESWEQDLSSKTIRESFYVGLVRYARERPMAVRTISEDRWTDTGHVDRYLRSRGQFLARAFNSLQYDEQRGCIEKRSASGNKLIGEIQWYSAVPTSLQYYLPRVFDHCLDESAPYIRMEYYPFGSLSDLWIFSRVSKAKWAKVFSRLGSILEEFAQFSLNESAESIKESLLSVYRDKTVQRFEQFRKQMRAQNVDPVCRVNGVDGVDLSRILNLLLTELDKQLAGWQTSLSVVHGDLCFSNILFDLRSNMVKLIDPRGSFGNYDIYGDQRYDLAKLRHSVVGRYDYIVRGMYRLNAVGGSLELSIREPDVDLSDLYRRIILREDETLEREVSLIEILLFLSMLPLHYEDIRKQLALLCVGVLEFDGYLRKYYGEGLGA